MAGERLQLASSPMTPPVCKAPRRLAHILAAGLRYLLAPVPDGAPLLAWRKGSGVVAQEQDSAGSCCVDPQ